MLFFSVVACQLSVDVEMAQQLSGVAGILTGNERNLAKDSDSPAGKSFQVANGCGNDVERTGRDVIVLGLGFQAVRVTVRRDTMNLRT